METMKIVEKLEKDRTFLLIDSIWKRIETLVVTCNQKVALIGFDCRATEREREKKKIWKTLRIQVLWVQRWSVFIVSDTFLCSCCFFPSSIFCAVFLSLSLYFPNIETCENVFRSLNIERLSVIESQWELFLCCAWLRYALRWWSLPFLPFIAQCNLTFFMFDYSCLSINYLRHMKKKEEEKLKRRLNHFSINPCQCVIRSNVQVTINNHIA